MLILVLMLNAMALIGVLGTFESNEQFAPSPEKTDLIVNKHPERIKSASIEDLKKYSTDLVGLVKTNDELIAGSYEIQNLLRKGIYWICGFNLFALALSLAEIKKSLTIE